MCTSGPAPEKVTVTPVLLAWTGRSRRAATAVAAVVGEGKKTAPCRRLKRTAQTRFRGNRSVRPAEPHPAVLLLLRRHTAGIAATETKLAAGTGEAAVVAETEDEEEVVPCLLLPEVMAPAE